MSSRFGEYYDLLCYHTEEILSKDREIKKLKAENEELRTKFITQKEKKFKKLKIRRYDYSPFFELQEKITSLEEDTPFDEELQETFDDYSSAVPATYGQCEGCKRVYKLTKTKSCVICGILLRRISESQ